ncbi:MAG: endonuclease/exonuclease/phosphatase family protein [Rhodospirillales bacterium]|nr:endonuclease/exonuclease/phosphatase family protein [Rhodospirillales bacterium]
MRRMAALGMFGLALALLFWSGASAIRANGENAQQPPKAPSPAKPLTLRVLTYNIHHGRGMDNRIDLPRIAKVIKDLKPDVVLLQEVDKKTQRSGGVDQAAKLGELTGMKHAYGKAMEFQGGEYGQAVLSHHDLTSTKVVALPADKGFEPRAALAATIEPKGFGEPVMIIGTHLDHAETKQRLKQIKVINEQWGSATMPTILAGDLNAKPGSEEIKQLLTRWTDPANGNKLPTYPSIDPRVRIDFILYRPANRFEMVEVEVIEGVRASDHCPVMMVVKVLPQAK